MRKTIEGEWGEAITVLCERAIKEARRTGAFVAFEHNGVTVSVGPWSDLTLAVMRWAVSYAINEHADGYAKTSWDHDRWKGLGPIQYAQGLVSEHACAFEGGGQ